MDRRRYPPARVQTVGSRVQLPVHSEIRGTSRPNPTRPIQNEPASLPLMMVETDVFAAVIEVHPVKIKCEQDHFQNDNEAIRLQQEKDLLRGDIQPKDVNRDQHDGCHPCRDAAHEEKDRKNRGIPERNGGSTQEEPRIDGCQESQDSVQCAEDPPCVVPPSSIACQGQIHSND